MNVLPVLLPETDTNIEMNGALNFVVHFGVPSLGPSSWH
jgi:hypothetical protein